MMIDANMIPHSSTNPWKFGRNLKFRTTFHMPPTTYAKSNLHLWLGRIVSLPLLFCVSLFLCILQLTPSLLFELYQFVRVMGFVNIHFDVLYVVREFMQRLSASLQANTSLPLTTIDLSENAIDERGECEMLVHCQT